MKLRQEELFEWQQKNFTQDHLRAKTKEELIEIIGLLQMALGMAEEVGEICHHILKGSQEIRGGVDGIDKKQVADGIGDFTVFGSQCLSHLGMDAEEEIEQVISDVLKRDWKKDPSGDGCQVQGSETDKSEDGYDCPDCGTQLIDGFYGSMEEKPGQKLKPDFCPACSTLLIDFLDFKNIKCPNCPYLFFGEEK